jgi:hypothetical protein
VYYIDNTVRIAFKENAMIKFLIGLLILALDIWAIMNVFRSSSSDGAKIGWLIGILVFPLLGFAAWFVAGPKDQKSLPKF